MTPAVKSRPPARSSAMQPGYAARRIAFAAVADVLRTRIALDDALGRAKDPDPLVRAIAVTTFRHLGTIGGILHRRLSKGLSSDERAFALLATGAAQILYLDVADHAAVDLSVEIARNDRKLGHLTGLVNAVLRRIARERDAILQERTLPLADAPPWLAERWSATFGPDSAAAIGLAHLYGAAIDLTVKSDPAGWAARLGGILLPTGSVRLVERGPITGLPGFAEGEWWVQDAAAALPARLLGTRPGERVLDMCAAPGGKTAQLAAAGAAVTALDRSASRLKRLAENMARLRLAADPVCADALAYAAEPFDAVLLDAPCTATGTLRRHPDVAWTKRAEDLDGLADLQARLIDHAATLVRPGGRLVYCVCSLEPEEGERQAARFLAAHPEFRRIAVRPAELGLPAKAATGEGDLRTLPDMMPDVRGAKPGLDGFFAACLSRNGG